MSNPGDGTAGGQAGNALADKVKGGWNVFHGAGEGIRGNINAFVDNVGEGIAGRGTSNTATQPAATGARAGAEHTVHAPAYESTTTTTTTTGAGAGAGTGVAGERGETTVVRGENEISKGLDRLAK